MDTIPLTMVVLKTVNLCFVGVSTQSKIKFLKYYYIMQVLASWKSVQAWEQTLCLAYHKLPLIALCQREQF